MSPEPPEVITAEPPEVVAVAMEHARRGVALQVALRWVLVGFVALTVATVPPPHFVGFCAAIAGGYALWALAVDLWTRRGYASAVRMAWLALLVDVVVLGVLTLLTGVAAPESWTSDVFTTGFLLIPVLAATQLRAGVCAAVVVPTALVYFLAAVATRDANAEPWTSLLLRSLVMVGVALGCVGLSRIQRSRVRTIGRLVRARSALLAELTGLEERERRALSEHLHDGALQYVLAARFDLDDARETGDPAAFDRLDQALVESSRLLRSTVAELHPAVLARAGLPSALRDLAAAAAARGGLTVDVDDGGWPPDERTTADALLYRTAGELLNNVVKHAQATTATVTLGLTDRVARLEVADDGVGMPENASQGALRRGHIGLASHTLRIDAAGGRFTSRPNTPHGTVVTVELPVGRSADTEVAPRIDRRADGVDGRAATP
jgi:two-component system, NarL family, sensor kinase